MPAAKDVVLCRYHYDPLDRLVGHSPAGADSVQRFYQKNRLTTEIQGLVQRSIIQTEDQLLAQHEGGNCTLLATDQQRSVLHELTATQQRSVTYTPYGFRSQQLDLPGFNGEQPDPVTGHYLLGNGYRAFNPVLMRFNSPDSLSPFGAGGLNAYAYCVGDPVNRVDPTGHWGVRQLVSLSKRAPKPLRKAPFKKTPHPIALDSPQKNVALHASLEGSENVGVVQSMAEPRFLTNLPQPVDVPPNLRSRRLLPTIPGDARLHTQWSEPTFQVGQLQLYDQLKISTRKMKRITTPLSDWRRVLDDVLPLPMIPEELGPFTLKRQQNFSDAIRRGQGLQ